MSNNTLKKRIDDDGNRIIEVYEGDLNEMQHQIDKLKWISVDDRLPEPEQAVLAAVNGLDAPIVLGLRWECCNPMIEGYFKDFLYWFVKKNTVALLFQASDHSGSVVITLLKTSIA